MTQFCDAISSTADGLRTLKCTKIYQSETVHFDANLLDITSVVMSNTELFMTSYE